MLITRLKAGTGAAALILLLAGASPPQVAGEEDHSAHHPEGTPAAPAAPPSPAQLAPAAPAAPAPNVAAPATGDTSKTGMSQMDMMMQMMSRMVALHERPAPMRPQSLERVEELLAYYRVELKITDAQLPRWNGFADVTRTVSAAWRQALVQDAAPGRSRTAIEQLDRRSAMLAAQLDGTRAVAAAARPLYDALTDTQKRTADELMAEHFADMRQAGL